MRFALLLLALAAAGCSTYQDFGFAGDMAAHQVTANTYRIQSRSSGYAAGAAIQDHTLLKAAETTRQAGGTHFLIVSAGDVSSTAHAPKPESAPTPVAGKTVAVGKTAAVGKAAVTAYSPAMAHTYIKPGQDTYFQVLTVKPGQPPPPGAFLADEIIEVVGKRVKRE